MLVSYGILVMWMQKTLFDFIDDDAEQIKMKQE
jgi:hypothetical protein